VAQESLADDPLVLAKKPPREIDPLRESLISLDEDQKNFLGLGAGNPQQWAQPAERKVIHQKRSSMSSNYTEQL